MNYYIEDFSEYIANKGYAKKTVVLKKIHLNDFFCFLNASGIKDACNVTEESIEEYKRCRFSARHIFTGKKVGRNNAVEYLLDVKKYFDFLFKRGYILVNPFLRVSVPKRIKRLPDKILSEKEAIDLIEKPDLRTQAGLRARAIMELLYSTGIRKRELLNLNIYDIDLVEGRVCINKGKNSKDRVLPVGSAASGFVSRYIKEVRDRWLKRSRSRRRKTKKTFGEPALFVTYDGKRVKRSLLDKIISQYGKQLGKGRKVSCHWLRHSFATHMLRRGASLPLLQQMLGHSSINSTQVYTKLCPMDLKEAHRKCHPRR